MLEKDRFKRYDLDVKKDRSIVSVSINELDRAMLEDFKQIGGVNKDSKALRIALRIAHNVVSSDFFTGLELHLFIKNKKKTPNLMK